MDNPEYNYYPIAITVKSDLEYNTDPVALNTTDIANAGGNSILKSNSLQSTNFVKGSSGWNVETNGDAQFSNIILIGGTIKYGQTAYATGTGFWLGNDGGVVKLSIGSPTNYMKWTGTGIEVFGGTITGGTIQTASSGVRIKMQSNRFRGIDENERVYFDLYSTNDAPLFFTRRGQFSSLNITGRPLNSVFSTYPVSHNILIPNMNDGATRAIGSSATVGTFESLYPLVYGDATKVATGTIILSAIASYSLLLSEETFEYYGYNKGTSAKQYKIEIDGVGSPNTFKWSDDNGSTWIETTVAITGASQTLTSVDGSTVRITFNATTGGVSGDYWTFTAGATSSSAENVLSVYQEKSFNTGNVLSLTSNAITSTNFKKMINLAGTTLYKSDGTTPNGNLSGSAGDICFGADSGKAYYCTGTTSWTAM